MNDESWKPVVGYEGFYEVSNLGNIRSIGRMVKSKNNSLKFSEGRDIKKILQGTGYYSVNLSRLGKIKTKLVHSLVLEAFCGPKPINSHCMHLDGDKTNNVISNLRYGSPSCNAAFMIDDGTVSKGEKRHNSKLTEESVLDIRAMAKEGISYKEIKNKYDVGITTICAIVKRRNWDWLE